MRLKAELSERVKFLRERLFDSQFGCEDKHIVGHVHEIRNLEWALEPRLKEPKLNKEKDLTKDFNIDNPVKKK